MRKFSNTVAIKKKSHRAVSTTKDNWSHVRLGSSIRFGEEKVWYQIGAKKKDLYIKEFEVNNNKVKIANNDNLDFLPSDNVKITYKEYGIYTIMKILIPGTGFYIGEIVDILGGHPSVDSMEGVSLGAKIAVTEVNYHGGIVRAIIKDEGRYIAPPSDVAEAHGRAGKSAMIKLEYKTLDKRVILNRTIKSLQNQGSKTIIFFDFNLPKGITKGKLSAEKWELTLHQPYSGETELSKGYEILKDFAPNSNFPLLETGSTDPEQILNLVIKRIASRFDKLEERLAKIEQKIHIGG